MLAVTEKAADNAEVSMALLVLRENTVDFSARYHFYRPLRRRITTA